MHRAVARNIRLVFDSGVDPCAGLCRSTIPLSSHVQVFEAGEHPTLSQSASLDLDQYLAFRTCPGERNARLIAFESRNYTFESW